MGWVRVLLNIILGASSLWLVVVYPLAKRFTNWPQLVLGATFNWGALLGCTAVTGKFVPEICIPLYLACISWTMIYDTIYAFQDQEEDILIGLGSTAITFGKNREAWLSFFGLTMMLNLLYSGYMQGLPWPFFVSLLGFFWIFCIFLICVFALKKGIFFLGKEIGFSHLLVILCGS
ncbi:unnamed protein product [Meloidogyne enterolobii]|uniref:Uncharacterized protein n=1 Tax=Meloidogyne enterolobii TaxID=390850 RepID=A0ACB0XU75_MELEN